MFFYLFIIIKNFIGKFFRKKSWDGNDNDGDLTILNLLMSILVSLALLYPAFGYFYIHPKYVCSSWKQKGHDLIREYSHRNDFGGDFPIYSYEKTKGDYFKFSFKSKLECEKVFRSIWSPF